MLRSDRSNDKLKNRLFLQFIRRAIRRSNLSRVFAAIWIGFWSPMALAQAAPGAGGPSPLVNMVPILFMLVVMYFLIMRPQQKKMKKHQQFLQEMKRGDDVVTSSGIFGRIEGLTDFFVTLEIAPDVRIKVLRSQVAGSAPDATKMVNP